MAENPNISATPPRFLSKYAKQAWKNVVPYLLAESDLKSVDKSLVEMYCTQYGIYRDAYDSIKKDGIQTPIYKIVQNSVGEKLGTDFGGYKRNPATTIYNDALKQLLALGAQLGLSPKSRAELNQIASTDDSGDSMASIAAMFGGKS